MSPASNASRAVPFFLAALLSACGPGGQLGGSAMVGPAGGTVNGPEGAKVVVPAGALAKDSAVGLGLPSGETPPPLPAGYVPMGKTFALTPHGTTFSVPVRLTIPYDASIVPPDNAKPLLLKTTLGALGPWAVVEGGSGTGGTFSADVTSFSFVVVVYEQAANATVARLNLPRTTPTAVASGPGGSLYIAGLTRDALDPAVPGGGAFIARYDASFTLQWAHVFPAQVEFLFAVPRLAVGLTGNACLAYSTRYSLVDDKDGPLLGGEKTDVRLDCFDPQGGSRAGYPKQVGAGNFDLLDDVLVTGAGDVTVLFTAFSALQSADHRPHLAQWNEAGVAVAAQAEVAMGEVPAGHRLLGRKLATDTVGNLLVVAHQVQVNSGAAGPQVGFKVQSLKAGAGGRFPLLTPGEEPSGLASDGAGNFFVLTVKGQVFGFRSDGEALAGFPVATDEAFGAEASFAASSLVLDGAGNLFVGGLVEQATGGRGLRDMGITSLTAAGKLRAGFPRVVGTAGDDASQVSGVATPLCLEPGADRLYAVGRVEDGEATQTAVVVKTPSL